MELKASLTKAWPFREISVPWSVAEENMELNFSSNHLEVFNPVDAIKFALKTLCRNLVKL